MTDNHKMVEALLQPPDLVYRKKKRAMEEELLWKVGLKGEYLEFHPVILTSRPARPTFYVTLNYSKVKPPLREIPPKSRSAWLLTDPALRQISNLTRRGPRDYFLPNLVKPKPELRVLEIPTTDEEYQARRTVATSQLNKLFGEWPAYNQAAFPETHKRKPALVDLSHHRKSTKFSVDVSEVNRVQKSDSGRTGTGKQECLQYPASVNKKNQWKNVLKEVLLQTKAADMKLPKKKSKSELRIYVSSTPDVQEEREFLEEVVYPRIHKFCEEVGLNCHVVDLRSGAGVLDNDPETFKLIEREIKACQNLSVGPFFIALLGHVLDDQKIPGFLPRPVYEEIRMTLLQEKIIGIEAFDDIYRLDSNQVPPVYVRQPICIADYHSSEEVEALLHAALSQAIASICHRKAKDQEPPIGFHTWSTVVKEIQEALRANASTKGSTLCFMLDSDQVVLSDSEKNSPMQRLRQDIVQYYQSSHELIQLTSVKGGAKSLEYMRKMSDTVEGHVRSLLQAHLQHQGYHVGQQLTEGVEISQHVEWALQDSAHSLDNEMVLAEVKDLVIRGDPAPKTVLLWGLTGTGKSSLVSQMVRSAALWEPTHKIVFRRLGMTMRSSSLFRVLESLLKQLNLIYSLDIEVTSNQTLLQTVFLFCSALKQIEASYAKYGKLVLILDQIEKLPDLEAHHLLQILDSLTAGTTVILTLQSPHSLMSVLTSHKTASAISRPYLTRMGISKLLTTNLKLIRRTVTDDQLELGLDALPRDITPLHAHLLLLTFQLWPSHTLPEIRPLSERLDEDFMNVIESLESEICPALIKYMLSFLACAKHGLTDQELLYLLSKDPDLMNEIKEEQDVISVVDGFPYQYYILRLLSRLSRFVQRVKLEGEVVYQINSDSLHSAISSRYLNSSFFYTVHSRLANYFMFIRRGQFLSSKDICEKKQKELSRMHWRTLHSVPHHLCYCSADTSSVMVKLKELVFYRFTWLVNVVYAGYLPELLSDMSHVLANVCMDSDVQRLQQLLLSVRHTVTYNPLSLAGVLASFNMGNWTEESDSLRNLVQEASMWLKQVHLQVLVPVLYSLDKTNQLFTSENKIAEISNILPMEGTDKLIVQRMNELSVCQIVTDEEVPFTTLTDDIVSLHQLDFDHIVLLTRDSSNKYIVKLFNFYSSKLLKSVSLKDSSISWFDARSLKMCYFAVDSSIKRLNLELGSVSTILTTKGSWALSSISLSKPEVLLTVSTGKKTRIEATSILDITKTDSVHLKNEPLNKHCRVLLSTKDGKFVLFISEREVHVIERPLFNVVNTYQHQGLPIVQADLSRSHEHVFVAYLDGTVTCHVLSSGSQCMRVQTRPKLQLASSRDESLDNQQEIIQSLLTSEDDHFLFCGTNLGAVYVLNVPTGLQVVCITTQQNSVQKLIYLTSRSCFQYLVSQSAPGTAAYSRSLRPLLRGARQLLLQYITDEDLLHEENTKLNLQNYFTVYEVRKKDRMFLNGPDVTGFYRRPPADVFEELFNLEPAFGQQADWERTGKVRDISEHLQALVCGKELGSLMLTVSSDLRLARWNLQTGDLVWSRCLPQGPADVARLESVCYDQAVLMVQHSSSDQRYLVSVVYTETHKKMMTCDHVSCYWLSSDRTKVMILTQNVGTSPVQLYLWDLVNMQEDVCHHLTQTWPGRQGQPINSVVRFSPMLTSFVSLDLQPCPDVIIQTTTTSSPFQAESSSQSLDTKLLLSQPKADSENLPTIQIPDKRESSGAVDNNINTEIKDKATIPLDCPAKTSIHWAPVTEMGVELNHRKLVRDKVLAGHLPVKDAMFDRGGKAADKNICVVIPVHVTASCLMSETELLLGTNSGHLLMVPVPSFHPVWVLGQSGPRSEDELTEAVLQERPAPHNTAVLRVLVSENCNMILSSDDRILYLWDAKTLTCVMKMEVAEKENITQLAVAKDAVIVAAATSSNIIHLWTPITCRQVADYMTEFDITDLQLTCDCRKVLVRGIKADSRRVLEIFEILNIDDILMQVASRRESQQNEYREFLENERKASRLQNE